MLDSAKWDFEAFRCRWTYDYEKTFAYWLCAIDRGVLEIPPLTELISAMRSQCDIEEQAVHVDRFDAIHKFSPGILRTLAPVSLAIRWSPFPTAVEMFGDPIHQKFQKDDHRAFACAVWRPEKPDKPATAPINVHEQHFRALVPLLVDRVNQQRCDLFVAGMIGWEYDTERDCPISPETEKAMSDYGYVYTQRTRLKKR
nr:hypothetical protein [Rhodopirellula sp. SM50]